MLSPDSSSSAAAIAEAFVGAEKPALEHGTGEASALPRRLKRSPLVTRSA